MRVIKEKITKEYQHKNLAAGGWQKLSLAEQLGNIGSETNRAFNWSGKDEKLKEAAIFRALELIDLTISDPRWRHRLKEIVRLREILCDTIFGDKNYKTTLEDLNKYLLNFAMASKIK